MIDRKEFEEVAKAFINSRDDNEENEWYCTEEELVREIMDDFVRWYWENDIAKEERYQQYLKLKQEFENG